MCLELSWSLGKMMKKANRNTTPLLEIKRYRDHKIGEKKYHENMSCEGQQKKV